MSIGLKLITPASATPVLTSEAKLHLKVDTDDDDSLINDLLAAATRYVEKAAARQFCTATWLASYDRFPRYSSSAVWQQYSDGLWDQRIPQTELSGRWWPDKAAIRLPRPPLQSIVSITYIDGTGTQQTLDPTTYLVDTNTEPGRITPSYGNIWPIIRQQIGSVQVTFVAGYGTPQAVPATMKIAIKMLIGHWYLNREAVAAPLPAKLELAVEALIDMEWPGTYA